MPRPSLGGVLRLRPCWLVVTLVLAVPIAASAQAIIDPRVVEFSPSPDHNAVLGDGRPALTKYLLQVYVQGQASPFQTIDMGKPAPQSDGMIRYDFSASLSSWQPPGGTYESRVAAVGPQGTSVSGASNAFTLSPGGGCSFTVSQSSVSLGAAPMTTSVSLGTGPGCPWTTSSNASWLTVSPVSGWGPVTVALTVSANTTSSSRTGSATLAGQAVWVMQSAAPSGGTGTCAASVMPASVSLGSGGGTAAIAVSIPSGCAWTASSGASWISASPSSGTGNGSMMLSLSANLTGGSRTATVSLAGQAVSVAQAGGSGATSVGSGDGLRGEYFDNMDLTAPAGARVDATLDFDWGTGAPLAGMGPDTFSGRWTGQVQAQVSETYTFHVLSDDGVRVWVNSQLLVDNWTSHSPTENSGSIALSAGQRYDIKVEYFENGGGALARLLWSSPSTPKAVVPKTQLYSAPGTSGGTGGESGSGDGLRGEYYDNWDFTGLVGTRVDPTVDFNWGVGAPQAGMGADTFSVRWTGKVLAQASETYTFYTLSDDGVRLWVNGQLLIDNWTNHSLTENSGAVALTAGQAHDVKLEYYENGGGAAARLLWSSPTTPKGVVPRARLFSSASGPGGTGSGTGGGTGVGSGDGLRGDYFDNWDFTAPVGTRVDQALDFDWGAGTPQAGMGADTFSVRWTGKVQAQFSETYTFHTLSDDGVRLWVNGQLLIDNWTNHSPIENVGSIALVAGQSYDIKVEYFESGGGAVARLLWSSPSTAKAVVPRSQLYSAASSTGVTGGTNVGGGLRGEYFDNWEFTAPVAAQIDPTVDFEWGSGAPLAGMQADTFSVRWTGRVVAPTSEVYTFYTTSDDGVRLWVNGQLLIDNWTNHAPVENSGTIALVAGQAYTIKLEYFENGGGAVVRLLWSSRLMPKAVVPRAVLGAM